MKELNGSEALFYAFGSRSLYFLHSGETYKRVTGPSVLMLSLDGQIELMDDNDETLYSAKSFLVPADSQVSLRTNHSRIAICFMDDAGADLVQLKASMQDAVYSIDGSAIYSEIKHEAELLEDMNRLWVNMSPADVAQSMFDKWLQFYCSQRDKSDDIDARVLRAVEMIKMNSDQNISVNEIAKEVNLSTPRLIQLFKQVTGTSIRRYRLWQRVFNVIRQLKNGSTLTDMAIDAGFSDYSQCYRVYKEMGGSNLRVMRDSTDVFIAA